MAMSRFSSFPVVGQIRFFAQYKKINLWLIIHDTPPFNERLEELKDPFSLFRCRSIGHCSWPCPDTSTGSQTTACQCLNH